MTKNNALQTKPPIIS